MELRKGGVGRQDGHWYRKCWRKGCEIEKERERKLEAEMARGWIVGLGG